MSAVDNRTSNKPIYFSNHKEAIEKGARVCTSCKWYDGGHYMSLLDGNGNGICRRVSPMAETIMVEGRFPSPDRMVPVKRTTWPSVCEIDWCGEWETLRKDDK